MWLKQYENLKNFGGEMNELFKFEGVKKPTLFFSGVLYLFCLIDYVRHIIGNI